MKQFTITVDAHEKDAGKEGTVKAAFFVKVTCEDATMLQALAYLLNHIGIKEENREAQATFRTTYPDIVRESARARLLRESGLTSVPVKPDAAADGPDNYGDFDPQAYEPK